MNWSSTNQLTNAQPDKIIEVLNNDFISLIDSVKSFSVNDKLAIERLLAIRDTLVQIETEIIKESIRSNIAVS